MQAVILAAGKSTRTYPLTLTRPKPLLKVSNKTILEHNLDALRDIAEEVIIVTGYKKNMIREFIKKNNPGIKIKFLEQKAQLGTGHAVSILEDYIKDKFMLMLGDNLYSKKDMGAISKYQYSILVKRVKNWQNFGVVKEKNNILIDIFEKPKEFISPLVSCGLFLLDSKIFSYLKDVKKSERGEYELTDALRILASSDTLHCIKSESCFQVTYPWDLLTADIGLRNNKNVIGKASKINGNIINSTIGDNCTINGNIRNSIIMDNTTIDKNSIVEDSIFGENVHFNGQIIAENNIYSIVKNKKIKVGRFGTVMGDKVNAEDVNITPGCKIWPNKNIRGKINHDIK
jgi:NDP-sugar pyrophosphorylase family protein|tara:strand:+ start:5711 stop:6742 length:1032 start_codon:yes stop_codon:yes gene_type:complete